MLIHRLVLCLLALGALNAHAALQVRDLYAPGDGLITFDTVSRLEWLDLSVTRGRTYNYVSSRLGAGQEFAGWSYATLAQAKDLYAQFGFDVVSTSTPLNTAALSTLTSYLGELYSSGSSGGYAMTGNTLPPTAFRVSMVTCTRCMENGPYQSVSGRSALSPVVGGTNVGSLLIRPSEVPVPGAFWLFGSGMLGLFAAAKRVRKIA